MNEQELLKYYMKRTDERLTKIDQKIDSLLEFKWKVLGSIVVVSAFINILVAFIAK